jgi:hypothetical protein
MAMTTRDHQHPPKAARPPWALTVIALIGAVLSFNAIRVAATPYAGFLGGIATAVLFDAAMWLASRWYIDTVRAGHPLRPALWLSLVLVAVTLAVNVAGATSLADGIVHGIGPGLFAAFTWIEATIELRTHRAATGARERIPASEKVVHPIRAGRVWLMMLASGTTSYTVARAMCQNREARRRTWRAEHRPRWVTTLARLRPGWRARVDPTEYVAYRWGAFASTAHVIAASAGNAAGRATGESGRPFPALSGNGAGTPTADPVTVPGAVPRSTSGGVPETAARNTRHRSATPGPAVAGTPASGRGAGLPEGIDNGRDLGPEQVAELIRAGRAGVPDPSVRHVMHTFAVSYDKASRALELFRGGGARLRAVNGTPSR